MPRALVREQQRTVLTRAQAAMIGLIAVTCTSSVQPVYPAPTSKRLQTWHDHYSRDDGLEDIVDYALVHQGLERERTKKYKTIIEKEIVRADNFRPWAVPSQVPLPTGRVLESARRACSPGCV